MKSHRWNQKAFVALALVEIGLVAIPLTQAAPGAETGSIALVQSNPKLGDTVTFRASFSPANLDSKNKGGIRIQVMCYQDGKVAFGSADHFDQPVLLGGAMSDWFLNDGPAHCQADLYYWSYKGGQKWNGLASTTFEAGGR